MKVLSKLILVFPFGVIGLFALAPDTAWTKTFGGSYEDYGRSVQQTTDGGYIIAGWTDSYGTGNRDIYLIKTDSMGDTLWTRTYGGDDDDLGFSVQQTTDGGYIVAGATWSYGAGSYDVYLIKTDSLGDTLWTKTYGHADYDYYDLGYSVQQTTDGGYIVVGWSWIDAYGSDVYLIKTDSVGDTLWTRRYEGGVSESGELVQQTDDGGYIVIGIDDADVFLIKTDSVGDTLWTRAYGGSSADVGYSVQQTTDGGYIVTGYTCSYGAGLSSVYLIKTDSLGDTLWTRTYGGSGVNDGYSVRQTTEGGYIVAGYTNSYGMGGCDVYLIKTDPLGDTLWTKTVGGDNWEMGYSVQQTTDGGYIVAGWTEDEYNVYLIKIKPVRGIIVTSPNGGEEWQADSTHDITWTSAGTSGGVKIEYSLNNGGEWTEIIASIPDTGAYPWTTPDTTSYNCLVRISDTNGTLSATSDEVFTIFIPFITVTSPNGGERWYNGDDHNITWVSAGTSGEVKIEYSINNGLDWAEIIASTPDNGSYLWNPPDTVSDSCLVSISDTNGTLSDMSDSVFSIIPGSGVTVDGLPDIYSLNAKAIATGSQVKFTYTLPEKANDVRFTLYNIAGLKIREENIKESPAGFYSGKINMNGISKGIYFIKMEVNGGNFTQTKKFLLM